MNQSTQEFNYSNNQKIGNRIFKEFFIDNGLSSEIFSFKDSNVNIWSWFYSEDEELLKVYLNDKILFLIPLDYAGGAIDANIIYHVDCSIDNYLFEINSQILTNLKLFLPDNLVFFKFSEDDLTNHESNN